MDTVALSPSANLQHVLQAHAVNLAQQADQADMNARAFDANADELAVVQRDDTTAETQLLEKLGQVQQRMAARAKAIQDGREKAEQQRLNAEAMRADVTYLRTVAPANGTEPAAAEAPLPQTAAAPAAPSTDSGPRCGGCGAPIAQDAGGWHHPGTTGTAFCNQTPDSPTVIPPAQPVQVVTHG
jgi:hypothetical protein